MDCKVESGGEKPVRKPLFSPFCDETYGSSHQPNYVQVKKSYEFKRYVNLIDNCPK